MAQRSAAAWIGTVVVTAVIAVGLTVFTLKRPVDDPDDTGDTETWLRLRQFENAQGQKGPCELVSKEAGGVPVKNGKHIMWRIENLCDTAQTLTLGNFRTPADENVQKDNCEAATVGAVTWPFDSDTALAKRQETVNPGQKGQKINLKANLQNPTKPVVYYFDICLGSGPGKKVDPRLVIDP